MRSIVIRLGAFLSVKWKCFQSTPIQTTSLHWIRTLWVIACAVQWYQHFKIKQSLAIQCMYMYRVGQVKRHHFTFMLITNEWICASSSRRPHGVTDPSWARHAGVESRREQLTKRFFKRSVLPETSCLHYLLPDKRDVSVTGRLRHARTFEPLKSRTVKFRNSFIP